MHQAVIALDHAWDSLWRAEVGLRAAEALARELGAEQLATETEVLRKALTREVDALHEVIIRRTQGLVED
jgi:hypothetical protein